MPLLRILVYNEYFHVTKFICERNFQVVCNVKSKPWSQVWGPGYEFLALGLWSYVSGLGLKFPGLGTQSMQ